MMNCEQATRLMSDGHERDLTFRERAAIRMHNLLCDGCKNFNAQVRDLGVLARRFAKERDALDSTQESDSSKNNE